MKKLFKTFLAVAMLAVGGFNVYTAMDGDMSKYAELKIDGVEALAGIEVVDLSKTKWYYDSNIDPYDGHGWRRKWCDYSNDKVNHGCNVGDKHILAFGPGGPSYEEYKRWLCID